MQDVARARLRVAQGKKGETEGRVVAELMFGFWRLLHSKVYEPTLWQHVLRFAYPNSTRLDRREVYTRLDDLNTLLRAASPPFWAASRSRCTVAPRPWWSRRRSPDRISPSYGGRVTRSQPCGFGGAALVIAAPPGRRRAASPDSRRSCAGSRCRLRARAETRRGETRSGRSGGRLGGRSAWRGAAAHPGPPLRPPARRRRCRA